MTLACPRCGAPREAAARFCSSCGNPLDAPAGTERKLATIVFADLVGFTALAAGTDPEELRGRLAPFFDVAGTALAEHGGTVEKYIGDAVMAVFGVPVAHGDDPDRAVAAALALVDRLCDAGDGLDVRIGIDTGEVLAGASGDLSVTGEAVNAAARLQTAAAKNEVLVGERTARSCRSSRLEPRDDVDAKGFPEPLRAWRALPGSPSGPRERSPFVGRSDDLDLLRLVYRRAVRERLPELVTVTGEAGIGKTRLAIELLESIAEDDPPPEILFGRNPPYGRGIAFWALGEIIRAAAGAGADESVGHVQAALASKLKAIGADDGDEIAAAVAAALGGADGGDDVEDELRRGWRRLVALLASDHPVVIALDDAHWADDGLLELLEEIAFRLEDAPVLILCTTRPELLERRPDFGRAARNVTQIELRPLRQGAIEQLATSLFPGREDDLARRVAETAGGNPFFAEEVVRSLVEEGGRHGHSLPDTVQAAITARLDLLPADEKAVVQHGAVLGIAFPERVLSEVLGRSPKSALDALSQKALLQERVATEPGRWEFRHQLIRDVAYRSLPRANRALLHERAAEAIASGAGERYAELAEIVAFHRVQAAELESTPERAELAWSSTVDAAEHLFARGASIRAQELYEHAAELGTTPAQRIEPLRTAAGVASRRFRGDKAVHLLRRMAEVAEHEGEPGQAATAYARAIEVATRMVGTTGMIPLEDLQRMLTLGRQLADRDDAVTRTRLVLDEAWIAWREGEDEKIAKPARQALAMARKLGDVPLLSSALDAASASSWFDAHHRAALECARERLELLEGAPSGDPAIEIERSDTLHMMVECLVQVSEFRDALRYAAEGRDADLEGGIVYSAWARMLLPNFFLGEWDNVLDVTMRVRDAWAAMERPPSSFMSAAVATAGAIHGFRGDQEAFEDWIGFGEEVGLRGAKSIGTRALRAEVALHSGDPELAASLLDEPEPIEFWWRANYAAVRAEAFVLAGADADAAIEVAAASVGDNRYAGGVLDRARGLHAEDAALLQGALETFRAIECPHQAARTGWLLGGEEREAAEREFARLGATAPQQAPLRAG